MLFPKCTLSLLAVALSIVSTTRGEDWPQWRGPQRNGHVPATARVPDVIPAEPKVVWRLKVGEGLASPIVAGGKVFYFDAVDGKETLHAIDSKTAKELWQVSVDETFRDTQGPAGPRCTPMADGDRVYAVSCKGELQCRKIADGQLVWRANYTNDFGATFVGEKGSTPGAARHGNNGTPVIDGDHLIACVGGTNDAGVVCFDKFTGKVVWKSQSDMAAYAPPVIATIAGVKHVVCFVVDGLIGLDAATGNLLWRVPMKTAYARHVTTPVVYEDMVVVGSHQVGLVGIRISKSGGALVPEQAWLSKEAAINFSSPVAVDRHLFGVGPAKDLFCVDIQTGKRLWMQPGLFATSADKAHASFLVMGHSILMLTDSGVLVQFAASPDGYKELGRAQVCGVNWCNPAYANGQLFVRDGIKTTGELVCLSLTE